MQVTHRLRLPYQQAIPLSLLCLTKSSYLEEFIIYLIRPLPIRIFICQEALNSELTLLSILSIMICRDFHSSKIQSILTCQSFHFPTLVELLFAYQTFPLLIHVRFIFANIYWTSSISNICWSFPLPIFADFFLCRHSTSSTINTCWTCIITNTIDIYPLSTILGLLPLPIQVSSQF